MNIIRTFSNAKWLSREKKLSLYPPFLLMGVKVLEISNDPIRIRLKLPLNWKSVNSGGSLFGGFQASLADPIAPMGCLMAFPEYHVWTKDLHLDFQLPGNSDLELRFEFDPAFQAEIQKELDETGRANPTFEYGLYRADGKRNARVRCTVAIREEGYRKKIK